LLTSSSASSWLLSSSVSPSEWRRRFCFSNTCRNPTTKLSLS
jgi:hypothetical protein